MAALLSQSGAAPQTMLGQAKQAVFWAMVYAGATHPFVAQAYRVWGTALTAAMRYDEAVARLQHALTLEATNWGTNSAQYGTALVHLANAYLQQDQPLHARPTLTRAVSILAQHPDSHADFIEARYLLGELFHTQGDLWAAHEVLVATLDAVRRAPRADPLMTARLIEALGGVAISRGRHRDAQIYFEQALDAYQIVPGPLRLQAVIARARLAELQTRTHTWHEAERNYRTALAQATSILEGHHILISTMLVGLGELLRRRGEVQEASQLCGRAANIIRTATPVDIEWLAQAERCITPPPQSSHR